MNMFVCMCVYVSRYKFCSEAPNAHVKASRELQKFSFGLFEKDTSTRVWRPSSSYDPLFQLCFKHLNITRRLV